MCVCVRARARARARVCVCVFWDLWKGAGHSVIVVLLARFCVCLLFLFLRIALIFPIVFLIVFPFFLLAVGQLRV